MSAFTQHTSDSEKVREFTGEAGQPTPETPTPMNPKETKFIAKMILDEVMELMQTHWTPEEGKAILKQFIDDSEDLPKKDYPKDHPNDQAKQDIYQCADQADALVDVYYYSQNAACKKGMNLSSVFNLVHGANMAKRDPSTGHFIRRESDGKVLKPKGWKPPDVEAELMRQAAEGSWGASTAETKTQTDYSSNGAVAQRIASVTPYFPFKGVPRFYDIGGFLKDPEAFQLAIDVFVERYRNQNIDAIAGFDARGFILGPPIALALKKPFIMLRKKGKMPNAITGKQYSKEYAGNDSLSIPRGSISKGDKVLLIDDLVATGGTLVAGIDLVKGMGGVVVEAACVVELKFLNARQKFEENNHGDVKIWALMDEEILTLDGLKDESIPTDGYVDDGEAH